MTTTPFPCSGKLYDLNGTSVVEGGIIGIFNFTKGTYTKATTNSAGEYTLDLANLSGETPYEENDVLYLYASYPGKNAVIRGIIGSSDEAWEDRNIYLKEGDLKVDLSDNTYKEKPRIVSILASCTSAKSVLFVEKLSDIQRAVINVSGNGNTLVNFLKPGLICNEGFWILIGSQGVTIENQSANLSNAIGDTASNATNFVSCVYF